MLCCICKGLRGWSCHIIIYDDMTALRIMAISKRLVCAERRLITVEELIQEVFVKFL